MKPYQQAVDGIVPSLTRFFNRGFAIHAGSLGADIPLLCGPDAMVMVVSTHRSQTDYFLFGWELYKQGLKYVRIAAGDNLTGFPFLGKKFKAFGAFAVHRDAGFKRNYVRELCGAVVAMMENGEPILLFPEGGRSYDGAMMEVKAGVLLSAIIAQARNPLKKVYLLPASISYERLPELPYFGMLKKGRELRKKDNCRVRRLWGAVHYFGADIIAFAKLLLKIRLGGKQGDVFIDFGKPVGVSDIVDIKANFRAAARDEFSGHQASVRIVCDRLYGVFLSLYRLLPEHIVSAALKGREKSTKPECLEGISRALALCREQKRNCATLETMTGEQVLDAGLRQLRHVKAIRLARGAGGPEIGVRKPAIINYYASALN